jgi:hypothetical protein
VYSEGLSVCLIKTVLVFVFPIPRRDERFPLELFGFLMMLGGDWITVRIGVVGMNGRRDEMR